ncbi:MAG: hypothetical protein AAF989_12585 [Planctomycetota bacterium]
MFRMFLVFVTALVAGDAAIGNESTPKTLLGFLKPGMEVSVEIIRGNEKVVVAILGGKQLEIIADAGNMTMDEILARYPRAKTQFDKAMHTHFQSVTARAKRRGKRLPSRDAVMSDAEATLYVNPRAYFGTISSVGKDFFELKALHGRRIAFSSRSLNRIHWQDELIVHVRQRRSEQ